MTKNCAIICIVNFFSPVQIVLLAHINSAIVLHKVCYISHRWCCYITVRHRHCRLFIQLGNNVHVLYIPKCELADGGQFTCKAENEAGEARSTADLVVRGKDEPPKVYYHVTRVFQQQQDMGMEVSRYQAGPVPFKPVTGQTSQTRSVTS